MPCVNLDPSSFLSKGIYKFDNILYSEVNLINVTSELSESDPLNSLMQF